MANTILATNIILQSSIVMITVARAQCRVSVFRAHPQASPVVATSGCVGHFQTRRSAGHLSRESPDLRARNNPRLTGSTLSSGCMHLLQGRKSGLASFLDCDNVESGSLLSRLCISTGSGRGLQTADIGPTSSKYPHLARVQTTAYIPVKK